MIKKTQKIISIFLLNLLTFSIMLPTFASPCVEENNYLEIERKNIKLNSHLNKMYDGYEYKIKNIYTSPITIENIIIWYNANGNVAFASVEKTNEQRRSEIFSTSKKLFLPTLGISFVVLPIIIPFSAVNNNIKNKTAKTEAEKFDILKTQKTFDIDKNQTRTIRTLALKNHTPILKVLYKNPITDETGTMDLK